MSLCPVYTSIRASSTNWPHHTLSSALDLLAVHQLRCLKHSHAACNTATLPASQPRFEHMQPLSPRCKCHRVPDGSGHTPCEHRPALTAPTPAQAPATPQADTSSGPLPLRSVRAQQLPLRCGSCAITHRCQRRSTNVSVGPQVARLAACGEMQTCCHGGVRRRGERPCF